MKDTLLNKNIENYLESIDEINKKRGRLVQICCTNLKNKNIFEMTYSFDIDGRLTNVRFEISENDELESISKIFPQAFLYENEIKDLYGIQINNINIDFEGNFYQLSMPAPFRGKGDA